MTGRPADVDELARRLGPLARRDEPFGARTTYRVGGAAALWAEPDDEAGLVEVAQALVGLDVPVLVFGNGSNMLVADAGFPGLVLHLGARFSRLEIDGTEVRAGAALALPTLARRTAAAGLRGLEWAVGVPGSVGGAVRMNAGGHGSAEHAAQEPLLHAQRPFEIEDPQAAVDPYPYAQNEAARAEMENTGRRVSPVDRKSRCRRGR